MSELEALRQLARTVGAVLGDRSIDFDSATQPVATDRLENLMDALDAVDDRGGSDDTDNATLERDRIMRDVRFEQQRQVDKFGEQHHSDIHWLGILMEELGEVARNINDVPHGEVERTGVTIEAIECVAVLLTWIENDLPEPYYQPI